MKHIFLGCAASMLLVANAPAPEYDIVIRGGRVLDGAGNPWVGADVAVKMLQHLAVTLGTEVRQERNGHVLQSCRSE